MPWLNPKRFLGQRSGVVGLAVMALLVLALSFTLPPVRAFAGDMLALFRVREIEVVEFSPSTLFNVEGAEATMQSLERVMDEQVTVETDGEAQAVDEATLRSLSWGPVRLPQPGEDAAYYALQPGAHLTVQVDLPRIQALLQELGYRDVALPATLDGSLVTVDLMPAAIAAYGDCERAAAVRDAGEGPPQLDGRCTVLMQMQSPVVTAPDGLDVQQLGQAYLQLLGMSATEAARFSERIDWTSTLVVPLPRSEVTYEDVRVDGVSGVLIRPTQHRLAQSEYLLMWVKGDIIYTLTGRGSTAEAQQVANSLQ